MAFVAQTMKWLSVFFLGSLLLGQLGAIRASPGIVLYLHDVALAALLIEGFVRYAMRGKFVRPRLLLPIALFALAGVLSLVTNSGQFSAAALWSGALYLGRWLLYAALYVLVVQKFLSGRFWLRGLFAAGVGVAVLGLLQFWLYPDLRNLSYLGWDPHYYRLFSTFLDPNFAGIFLVLTLLLGFSFLKKPWGIAGELIAFVALLLTYSRGSWLAFIAGITAYAVLRRKKILMAGIAVFIAIVVVLPKTAGSTLDILRTDSALARVANWHEGLALWQEKPLFGYGFNTVRSVIGFGLDSSMIFVAATTGVIGLAAFGFLLWSLARSGGEMAVFITAILVDSFFVNSAFYPWIMIWVWIVAGATEVSGGRLLSS